MAKSKGFIQLQEILAGYTKTVDEKFDKVVNGVAKEAKEKLKETSPEQNGTFAKSWAIKKGKGTYVVYNKEAWKTHLLENGHDVVAYGRKVGHVQGKHFVAPVNDWAEKEVIKRLEEEL